MNLIEPQLLHATFRPIVVAPTFNNGRTLSEILTRLDRLNVPILVVNDGSTDNTAKVLQTWLGQPRTTPAFALTRERNRGKGQALHTGFIAAKEQGFTHAVTIDTDLQLDPEQIPAFLEVAARNPDAFILGCRDDTAADYPVKSRWGRRLSNVLVRIESGVHVSDSQCGLRVYPLRLLDTVRCQAGYYGFETEIVTRAGWAGWPILELPAACRYLPTDQRVSHFRPVLDSVRATLMHFRLVGRALLPWPHPRFDSNIDTDVSRQPRWRRFLTWINPHALRIQVQKGQIGTTALASGLAVGVFIANLPIYGLQTVLCLYTAKRLHLPPLAVVAGSNAAIPPLNVALIASAVGVGHFLHHGYWPRFADYDPHQGFRAIAGPFLLDWAMGSIVVGIVTALTTLAVALVCAKVFRRKPVHAARA